MKKLIVLLSLLPLLSFAQVHTGAALGYDTNGRMIAAWNLGYEKSILVLDAEIRPSLSSSSFGHNYIGGKLGLNLINPDDGGLSIIPGVGYYHDLKSQDKTMLNKNYWAASLKTAITVTDDGSLFLDGLFINNSYQFEIGMQIRFHSQY